MIVHLTSVHPRFDTRIFFKECKSIARFTDVTLVVADSLGDRFRDGVKILDVGKPRTRWDRVFNTSRRILDVAKKLEADVYHFHDPELVRVGLQLKALGKKVVFDSHEDVPKQILSKPYLNPIFAKVLSVVFSVYENYACRRFDGVVAATPFIRDKFLSINPRTVDVNNYPILGELDSTESVSVKRTEVCYVGAISAIRGVCEIVKACEYLKSNARLNLGGVFSEKELERTVRSYPGWAKVNELGYLGREEVRDVLSRSVAGLVTLHPTVNYLDSLPVKMFEYMASGIPVIASDFPLWKSIVQDSKCGVLVDPMSPEDIAAAIDDFVFDGEKAAEMGRNGRRAVYEKYNWSIEEVKLIDFYRSIGVAVG